YVTRHYVEGGRTETRVNELLSGVAGDWFRGADRTLGGLKVHDRLIFIDLVDGRTALVEVSDLVRDGAGRIVAYETVRSRGAWRRWTPALRSRVLGLANLRPRGKALGTRWLTTDAANAIIAEIYGRP